MGTKIKDAELISKISGEERIPVSDGSGNPKAVRINQVGLIEVTYDELVALRDNGKLIAGMMYRMTDYETTTSQEGTRAAGHPFDLILTALDEKTLDEKCSAIQSARDTEGYFANSDLAAWDVRYCLDNDINRFGWADSSGVHINVDVSDLGIGIVRCFYSGTVIYNGKEYYKWMLAGSNYVLTINKEPNIGDTTICVTIVDGEIVYDVEAGVVSSIINSKGGKGVIYRMIDEAQNDISYDFKNIMYRKKILDGNFDDVSGVDTFVYTFNYYKEGENVDGSMNNKFFVHDNVIKYSTALPFNVFLSTDELHVNNIVSLDSPDCTFGNYCFDIYISNCGGHVFGDNCFGISVIDCFSNRFMEQCSNIRLIDNCNRNTFGVLCTNITLGDQCFDNTFDEQCENIEFSHGCHDNKIEGLCRYIKLLPYSSNNTLYRCSKVIISGDNIVFSKENNDEYNNIEITGQKLIVSGTVNDVSWAQASNYKIYCQNNFSSPVNIVLYKSNYCKHIYADSPHKDPIEYTDLDIYNAIQATKTN